MNRLDFFITGTDTDIGKTVVSVVLMRALLKCLDSTASKVAGIKPIASGLQEIDGQWVNSDVLSLMQASNVALPKERINRYAFKPAIAPHIAAEQSAQTIDIKKIVSDVNYCQSQTDALVVEGVGGWAVPLSMNPSRDYMDIAGLASCLQLPVILVVGMKLGCLNHALLTYKTIVSSGVPVIGWVANECQPDMSELILNKQTLQALLPVPLLFEVPYLDEQQMDTWSPTISEEFKACLGTM